MKSLMVMLVLSGIGIAAYAQRTYISTAPVTDTVVAKKLKANKVQDADGIKMGTAKDIIENITHAPKLSILLSAVRAGGLVETFKSKGPITLFAPTNAAFKKLPPGKLDTFMKKSHSLDMSSLLTCHAVAGHLSIKDITKQINAGDGKATLTTIGGCKIFATMDADHHIMLTDESGNQCAIETGDIEQRNGLIHVINGVLVPKPKII